MHSYLPKYEAKQLIVDPTDKDTKHINDQSTGTKGYLDYTKEEEKGKVNQLDVGNEKRSTQKW